MYAGEGKQRQNNEGEDDRFPSHAASIVWFRVFTTAIREGGKAFAVGQKNGAQLFATVFAMVF
jgi:hypothetical protein